MIDPYRMIEIGIEAEFKKITEEQAVLIAKVEATLDNRRAKDNPFIYAGKTVSLNTNEHSEELLEKVEAKAQEQIHEKLWFDE